MVEEYTKRFNIGVTVVVDKPRYVAVLIGVDTKEVAFFNGVYVVEIVIVFLVVGFGIGANFAHILTYECSHGHILIGHQRIA